MLKKGAAPDQMSVDVLRIWLDDITNKRYQVIRTNIGDSETEGNDSEGNDDGHEDGNDGDEEDEVGADDMQ